jgi:hypothetical protein
MLNKIAWLGKNAPYQEHLVCIFEKKNLGFGIEISEKYDFAPKINRFL